MDLPADGEYRHTLYLSRVGDRSIGYVLRTKHPFAGSGMPRIGVRYDLYESYPGPTEAYSAALHLVRAIIDGQATAMTASLSEVVGNYKLLAGAAARTDRSGWEPTLVIKSRKPENKGATQDFNSPQSALLRNPFPDAAPAAAYALEYGRQIVRSDRHLLKI